MRTKTFLKVFSLLGALVLLTACTAGAAPSSEPEPLPPPPQPSYSRINPPKVALERLVSHYEAELDPAIPKISVTAEYNKKTYPLPYDAAWRTGRERTEEDQKCSWFMNLMNNFWSLPRIAAGGIWDSPNTVPGRFTIRFTEQPDGPISIVDHITQEVFYTGDEGVYGVMKPLRSGSGMFGRTENTYEFYAENGELSFDLWEYYSLQLMSTLPQLRGLQVQCTYGEKRVEYYILFQTMYMPEEHQPYAPLEHLSPLTE